MSLHLLLFNVLLAQGAYYVVTGIWPLISIRTFQRVTGPKHDLWLVRTVGILVLVIGAVLLLGASKHAELSHILLAAGCALGLAGIDVFYVFRRVIAPIYLWDAALQILFVSLLAFSSVAG